MGTELENEVLAVVLELVRASNEVRRLAEAFDRGEPRRPRAFEVEAMIRERHAMSELFVVGSVYQTVADGDLDRLLAPLADERGVPDTIHPNHDHQRSGSNQDGESG